MANEKRFLLGFSQAEKTDPGLVLKADDTVWLVDELGVRTELAGGGGGGGSDYIIDARTEGAVGDGVANDTTAIQAAINTAQTNGFPLYLPAGTYKLNTGLTVTKRGFEVYGAGPGLTVFKPAAGITAITVTPSVSSMATPTILRGFTIDGDVNFGNGDSTGLKITGGAGGVVLKDMTFLQMGTGLDTTGQFCRFERVGAENCNLGFYNHQDAAAGGGNNNGWASAVAQGCRVGFMGVKDSVYPLHSNGFDAGCAFHDSSVCGMYLEGCQGFILIGPAYENNGLAGGAPFTVKTKSVAKSTFHFVSSQVLVNSLMWTSGTPDPNLVLDTSPSRVTIVDCGGTSILTSASQHAFSQIAFEGTHSLYGRISGITKWPAAFPNNPTLLQGQPHRTPSGMPNRTPSPYKLPLSAFATATVGTDNDPTFGLISHVQFAASAGTLSTNAVDFFSNTANANHPTAGNTIACTWLARSDRDATFVIRRWGGIEHTVSLLANQVYRFHIMQNLTGSTSSAIRHYPTNSVGAKLQLWDAFSIDVPAQDPTLAAFCAQGWSSPVTTLPTYTAANVTPTRSFDANAVTLDEIADVVGTLIADRRAEGRFL